MLGSHGPDPAEQCFQAHTISQFGRYSRAQVSGEIRYSEEFKIDALAQATEHGYSVKELAKRLRISVRTLNG